MNNINSAQYVYNRLMEDIFCGEMKPGQHLPSIPISQKYGVSRTPVLEALRRMESDGIVVSYPGKGTCLINPSKGEVREFFVVRSILEKEALKMAFENSSVIFTSLLKESIISEKNMYSNSPTNAEFIHNSLAFHYVIAEASGNSLLHKYIHNVLHNIYVFEILLYDFPAAFNKAAGWADHQRLLDLIETKDIDRACTELQNHILTAFEIMLDCYRFKD